MNTETSLHFLTNIKRGNARYIMEAANAMGVLMQISDDAYSQDGMLLPSYYVGVWTTETRDLTDFWNKYHEAITRDYGPNAIG